MSYTKTKARKETKRELFTITLAFIKHKKKGL